MDGYELAREMRKLPEGKNLVLAALSGWGQEEARQRAQESGFDRYFIKPFDADALERLLASSLEAKS